MLRASQGGVKALRRGVVELSAVSMTADSGSKVRLPAAAVAAPGGGGGQPGLVRSSTSGVATPGHGSVRSSRVSPLRRKLSFAPADQKNTRRGIIGRKVSMLDSLEDNDDDSGADDDPESQGAAPTLTRSTTFRSKAKSSALFVQRCSANGLFIDCLARWRRTLVRGPVSNAVGDVLALLRTDLGGDPEATVAAVKEATRVTVPADRIRRELLHHCLSDALLRFWKAYPISRSATTIPFSSRSQSDCGHSGRGPFSRSGVDTPRPSQGCAVLRVDFAQRPKRWVFLTQTCRMRS